MWRAGSKVFPSVRQGVGVFSSSGTGVLASEPGSYRVTLSSGETRGFRIAQTETAAPAFAGWTLSFPAGWGAPASVPVQSFESWSESQDPGVRYFSGTATYHATLHIPAKLITAQRQLWLNLGDVREIATVAVNGVHVETLWRAPFVTRIDPQLHAGDNTVDIEVSNLWPNRLIGDLQPDATARYTHTNVRAYTKDSPLLPSGILGPVTLEMVGVQALR